ncbi:hypothetical protein ASF06_13560 [Agreia sp. Leaf244]|nr:hypothetical protein ASF06_13560 [Agreia sp. Leaf244]
MMTRGSLALNLDAARGVDAPIDKPPYEIVLWLIQQLSPLQFLEHPRRTYATFCRGINERLSKSAKCRLKILNEVAYLLGQDSADWSRVTNPFGQMKNKLWAKST